MIGPVVDDVDFEVVFEQVQVVLHPLFAFGFQLLEGVELYLVLPGSYVLSFHVVFFSEFLEPQR